jgi:hypothetical protein
MTRWFAQLTAHGVIDSPDVGQNGDLVIERQPGHVDLGTRADADWLTLTIIRHAAAWAAQAANLPGALLVWQFSQVAVPATALPALLERWDATGEPPVLSIIDFVLGEHTHTTCGMRAFVGHEIAVTFRLVVQARDAARTLARLARHAMMTGSLDTDVLFEAPGGQMLTLWLVWDPEAGNMVTATL